MAEIAESRWVQTVSGEKVSVLATHPSSVRIQDVAQGLGKICRRSGQLPSFYSVAEHSVLASLCASANDAKPDDALAVLLKGSAAAFVGDIQPPFRALLSGEFLLAERQIRESIFRSAGLEFQEDSTVPRPALPANPPELLTDKVATQRFMSRYIELVARMEGGDQ